MKWKRNERTGHLEADMVFSVRLTRDKLEELKKDMPEGTEIISETPVKQPEYRIYSITPIKKEDETNEKEEIDES